MPIIRLHTGSPLALSLFHENNPKTLLNDAAEAPLPNSLPPYPTQQLSFLIKHHYLAYYKIFLLIIFTIYYPIIAY